MSENYLPFLKLFVINKQEATPEFYGILVYYNTAQSPYAPPSCASCPQLFQMNISELHCRMRSLPLVGRPEVLYTLQLCDKVILHMQLIGLELKDNFFKPFVKGATHTTLYKHSLNEQLIFKISDSLNDKSIENNAASKPCAEKNREQRTHIMKHNKQ